MILVSSYNENFQPAYLSDNKIIKLRYGKEFKAFKILVVLLRGLSIISRWGPWALWEKAHAKKIERRNRFLYLFQSSNAAHEICERDWLHDKVSSIVIQHRTPSIAYFGPFYHCADAEPSKAVFCPPTAESN